MKQPLISLLLFGLFLSFIANSIAQTKAKPTTSQPTSASTKPDITDYEKEALTAIKDMTSSLLLLATGVFALVGGYLAKDEAKFAARRILFFAFACYGVSLLAGLLVFMTLINQLQSSSGFDAKDSMLQMESATQILMIMAGSVLFFCFLTKNIEAKPESSTPPSTVPPSLPSPSGPIT